MTVHIRRLSWAGVEINFNDRRLLIDTLQFSRPALEKFMGRPHWPLVELEKTEGPTDALVTHIHHDHLDIEALRYLLGEEGSVYCHAPIVPHLRNNGLRAKEIELWQSIRIAAGLTITAVPAVDWRGDDQVSWVVEVGEHRLFHGGDTIWHGSWWQIAHRFEEGFDWAFLPVNGVIVDLPGYAPSGIPATLTPHQAVVATRLLRARMLCPIHYGQFNNPPFYVEQPDIARDLQNLALQEGVALELYPDGAFVL
ncbi:MBL fold metallo-hydrolase [Ktedonosporobacter rubrisoli]|nr:MBL fold metallo-hydrolase [Ktedonosporobacter rubrisoli]